MSNQTENHNNNNNNNNSFPENFPSTEMDNPNDYRLVPDSNSGEINESNSTLNGASPGADRSDDAPVSPEPNFELQQDSNANDQPPSSTTSIAAAAQSEGNIDNVLGASNATPQQYNLGNNVTSGDQVASDAGNTRSFHGLVQELMWDVNYYLNEDDAAYWRSRVLIAANRAVENSTDEEPREELLINYFLNNLLQEMGREDTYGINGQMVQNIENMTYEELLELQESIGSVKVGLTLERILARMSRYVYRTDRASSSNEINRCCICLEEYIDGQELGKLRNCSHEFHFECIKEWLMQKNSCPLCKRIGL